MRVRVEGPQELREGLRALLEDPRVGYSVVTHMASATVRLEAVSGGPVYVDGNGALASHVLSCVRELTGTRVLSGEGTEVTVGVPVGLEDAVLRGVLRGLMRYGRHGKRRWF